MLLIADAGMQDGNFARSVVLLCEHGGAGTFGLVLNDPLPVELKDVSPEFAGIETPVYRGGPVQMDTLHILHRGTQAAVGGHEVLPGVWWGGDYDRLRELLRDGVVAAADCRFFLGYSGWSGGQLDGELKRDSWYLHPATADLVFVDDPRDHWRQVLRDMGPEYALPATFPDHPMLN
jgi:putative transcriptional regulator